MNERSELLNISKILCLNSKIVSCQYSHSAKWQCKRMFSTSFTSFMTQHAILHQSSCVHSPQQNGIAKSKNHHLIETSCTLLLHSHTSLCFRRCSPYCMLHDQLYAIMSLCVQNNWIPHSVLFPAQLIYCPPHRVFECTCLFIISDMNKLSSPLKPRNAYFLGISDLKRILLLFFRYQSIFSLLDSTFFEHSLHLYPPEPLLIFEV